MLERIKVLHHACVRLEGSITIYVDPYELKTAPHDADLILVTHGHYDHDSPEDIQKVAGAGSTLVVPASEGQRTDFTGETLVTIAPGEAKELKGVTIRAVAAYNKMKPFHPKRKGWVGYVIELDGIRYYIAGDTDDTPEARAVSCDVAVLPVGGTYTMNAKAAAQLANALRPKAAVPYHYGSVVGSEKDAREFIALLDPAIEGKLLLEE